MFVKELQSMRTSILERPAPPALTGDITFGRFLGEVQNSDTSRWDGKGLLSRRRLQRKNWTYFGAFSQQYMVGFAIVDAGLLGTGFVYVYDRHRNLLVEEKGAIPLAFPTGFQGKLRGEWEFKTGGRAWKIAPDHDGWAASYRGKRISLELRLGGAPGMSTIAPSIGRPFHYTYKACTLPVHIDVTVDGVHGEAAGGGMIDYTLGYPPRQTIWNWASAAGESTDGRRFGLNLVAHFNNGLENALWLGDEIIPLAQANFTYRRENLEAPWLLTTEDGIVDLTFTPEGRRAEKLWAGVMASDFVQPFGKFSGRLNLPSGPVDVTAFGVTEEHLALW
jgi:hypothetical protein